MRTILLVALSVLSTLTSFAQKPVIDTNTIKNWTSVGGAQLSNNGMYAFYTIKNGTSGGNSLIVLDTKNTWKVELPETSGMFTSDSRYLIFKKEKDSLGILKTGSNVVRYLSNVQSYSLQKRNPTLLNYQLSNSPSILRIYDLETGKEMNFDHIQQYQFSADDSLLLILTKKKESGLQELQLFNLASGQKKIIWQGSKAGNFVISTNNRQIAFIVEEPSSNQTQKAIGYYRAGMDKATELTINNESSLDLERLGYFGEDGSRLFVRLKQKNAPKLQASPVDIWSYTDLILQSKQLKKVNSQQTYGAVINLQNGTLTRLEYENESIRGSQPSSGGEWRVIVNQPGDNTEEFWNTSASISVELISMKDGRRKKIPGLKDESAKISPKGRYLIYYNYDQKNYLSCEIETGITRNITRNIPVSWIGYSKDRPSDFRNIRGIAGWIQNDEAVLIYDENDIWQIDMADKKSAINVTNGYGKKHNVVFSLDLHDYKEGTVSNNERLLINAFNLTSKDNGYYASTLSKSGDPELLSVGPYLYSIPDNPYLDINSNPIPIKALNADVFLVQRMTANEAPNYFSTANFKTFIRLSDVQPQKRYNWLTSELVIWKGLDGKLLQGILYKPENFDSHRKYPVIIHYYERRSDELHLFLEPKFSTGQINIPWYVSNNYLVFLPDIHYKIGETGESAMNSIVSAAKYLSKLSYVNPKKMGIQGFSFGGYQTNYIVTHSDLFAAACSAASLSNLVSAYGGLFGKEGGSGQEIIEFRQMRIGSSLWEKPDLFIKNSPVFAADNVTTPLLMMHGKDDPLCPFANAIEFFTGLRRLGKKVWLLQYESTHAVYGASGVDFSIRMQQFFDHLLKDAPAPIWMTKGIPAKLKGIENGYALDPAGDCGKKCKVCKMWNGKMKEDSAATMKEISENLKSK